MQKRVAAGSTLTLSAGLGCPVRSHARARRDQSGGWIVDPLPTALRRGTDCRAGLRFGREWSEDQVDLVMTWIVEVPIGRLAQVKRGVAVLVAEVGIGAVFE